MSDFALPLIHSICSLHGYGRSHHGERLSRYAFMLLFMAAERGRCDVMV
jgi:hypothetical protein